MSRVVARLLPQTFHIRGARYDFSIEATPTQDECWFEIRATGRASGRWSIINTVNAVMGELLTDDQDADDARWADTPGAFRLTNVRASFKPRCDCYPTSAPWRGSKTRWTKIAPNLNGGRANEGRARE